jgi:hypothetical protein
MNFFDIIISLNGCKAFILIKSIGILLLLDPKNPIQNDSSIFLQINNYHESDFLMALLLILGPANEPRQTASVDKSAPFS